MQLRAGLAQDVPGALEVWRAGRAASGNRPSRAELDRVRERLAAPDALRAVLADGDRVLGVALGGWRDAAGELTPDLLHLELLVVEPGLRRAGLGTRLLEALADEAYLRGARRLSARGGSPAADAFLSAAGLQEDRSYGPTDARCWTAELDPPERELTVGGQIRLGQLLKLAGLVDTGAEAKALLAQGDVQVNGEVELRRGRQLADADVVVARDRAVRVSLADRGS